MNKLTQAIVDEEDSGKGTFSQQILAMFNVIAPRYDLLNGLSRGAVKTTKAGFDRTIMFLAANGESLPFADNVFHGATIAFGIRNFGNVERGLYELQRTLAPGCRLSILEFSIPRNILFRWIYLLYFQYVLPWIGFRISGHYSAYQYLPESVVAFPEKEDFVKTLKRVGFEKIKVHSLTGGIVALYVGHKGGNS